MTRDDKQRFDKYVAKPKSRYYDRYDTVNTPSNYDLHHATPTVLSDDS